MNLLGSDDPEFGAYDTFDGSILPAPGPFLAGQDVLTGRRHAAFHRLTRELFEARGVYDITFGYNLARLNLDDRHPDAGFRYAVEGSEADDAVAATEDWRVLRAEFTPTTGFCPQSDTLTRGAFRAWNGCRDRHEYDLVRVRVGPSHNAAAEINEELASLERRFAKAGVLPEEGTDGTHGPMDSEAGTDAVDTEGSPDAPF